MRLLLLVTVLLSYPLSTTGLAQLSAHRILDETGEARAKIEHYVAMCRVRGPMGDIWSNFPTNSTSDTQVYFEWSKSGQHLVVAFQDRAKGISGWKIRGISNGIWFWGDAASTVKHRRFKYVSDEEHTFMRMFDPLAIGLGFRNEFENGKNFAATLKGLQSTAAQPGIESKVEELGSRSKWSYNSDTEMIFDTKHSYWPVSLTYPTYKTPAVSWKVELEQRFGLDVPVHATLESRTPRIAERTFVDIEWISINAPPISGQACVHRLSEKFGIEIDAENPQQGTKE